MRFAMVKASNLPSGFDTSKCWSVSLMSALSDTVMQWQWTACNSGGDWIAIPEILAQQIQSLPASVPIRWSEGHLHGWIPTNLLFVESV